jgi:hypothetical protein
LGDVDDGAVVVDVVDVSNQGEVGGEEGESINKPSFVLVMDQ